VKRCRIHFEELNGPRKWAVILGNALFTLLSTWECLLLYLHRVLVKINQGVRVKSKYSKNSVRINIVNRSQPWNVSKFCLTQFSALAYLSLASLYVSKHFSEKENCMKKQFQKSARVCVCCCRHESKWATANVWCNFRVKRCWIIYLAIKNVAINLSLIIVPRALFRCALFTEIPNLARFAPTMEKSTQIYSAWVNCITSSGRFLFVILRKALKLGILLGSVFLISLSPSALTVKIMTTITAHLVSFSHICSSLLITNAHFVMKFHAICRLVMYVQTKACSSLTMHTNWNTMQRTRRKERERERGTEERCGLSIVMSIIWQKLRSCNDILLVKFADSHTLTRAFLLGINLRGEIEIASLLSTCLIT
jgi:hypothetical protein